MLLAVGAKFIRFCFFHRNYFGISEGEEIELNKQTEESMGVRAHTCAVPNVLFVLIRVSIDDFVSRALSVDDDWQTKNDIVEQ